jgi:hypothetical protein
MEVSIKIKGNKYVLPEEVNARQWSMISILPNDQKHLISTVLGCSPLDLAVIEDYEVEEVYQYCTIALKGLQSQDEPQVSFETLEEITFGQWVDLDVLAHRDANLYMCEILELLGFENAEDMPLSKALPTFKEYLSWRTQVYRRYRNLFGLDEASVESPEDNPVDIERIWYDAIMLLSDNNFSNMDMVTEKPYKAALNFMAWKKEQTQKEIEQLKKIQKK